MIAGLRLKIEVEIVRLGMSVRVSCVKDGSWKGCKAGIKIRLNSGRNTRDERDSG